MGLNDVDLKAAKDFSNQELVEHLETNAKVGLSQAEAQKRIETFGANTIEEKKESLLLKFFKCFLFGFL